MLNFNYRFTLRKHKKIQKAIRLEVAFASGTDKWKDKK